jgi:hypothetical protein
VPWKPVLRALWAEQDGVHDPPRQQREQPGDHQRAGENQDHDAAVIGDAKAVRPPHPTEASRA